MTQTSMHNHDRSPTGTLAGWFAHFAQSTAVWTGHPTAFLLALSVVVIWIITGPIFSYSDTWQLVINTGTTIVTFLMVFLIQNTQNRDMMAVQLKLSELVLAKKGVENKYAAIEDLSDTELEELHNDCRARATVAEQHLQRRRGAKHGNGGNGKPKPHATKSGRRAGHPGAKS